MIDRGVQIILEFFFFDIIIDHKNYKLYFKLNDIYYLFFQSLLLKSPIKSKRALYKEIGASLSNFMFKHQLILLVLSFTSILSSDTLERENSILKENIKRDKDAIEKIAKMKMKEAKIK